MHWWARVDKINAFVPTSQSGNCSGIRFAPALSHLSGWKQECDAFIQMQCIELIPVAISFRWWCKPDYFKCTQPALFQFWFRLLSTPVQKEFTISLVYLWNWANKGFKVFNKHIHFLLTSRNATAMICTAVIYEIFNLKRHIVTMGVGMLAREAPMTRRLHTRIGSQSDYIAISFHYWIENHQMNLTAAYWFVKIHLISYWSCYYIYLF